MLDLITLAGMNRSLTNLKKLVFVLAILTFAGLVIDYIVDKVNFPGSYTLFPLSLLIIALLVMLVIWLFHLLIQNDR